MATSQRYGMGQIRYNPTTSYVTYITGDSTDAPKFESVNITANGLTMHDQIIKSNFSKNNTYYLNLVIPKDRTYNNTFEISLIDKPEDPTTASNIQILKYFTVRPPENATLGSTEVIVYLEKDATETTVRKMYSYPDDNMTIKKDEVVRIWENNADQYYLCLDDSPYPHKKKVDDEEIIDNQDYFNNITNNSKVIETLLHSWETSSSDNQFDIIDLVFTPDNTYTALWVKLERTNTDSSIYHRDDSFYGRDFSKGFKGKLANIENLISDSNSAWTNIGIYGRPNTKMHINGEELRIPQSGYFELNDFNITSFGIVADNSNPFTVDYQYKIDPDTNSEDEDEGE